MLAMRFSQQESPEESVHVEFYAILDHIVTVSSRQAPNYRKYVMFSVRQFYKWHLGNVGARFGACRVIVAGKEQVLAADNYSNKSVTTGLCDQMLVSNAAVLP